jgi:peptidyl-prolyl cis-trans isomerase C
MSKLALVASLAAILCAQSVYAVDGDTPLLTKGNIVVTYDDFQKLVDLRVPAEQQAAVLSRPGAIRKMMSQLFIIRGLAEEGRQANVEQIGDNAWQMALTQDRQLMEAFINFKVEEAKANVDWERKAREYYLANPDEFKTPERIKASHVLIGTKTRSEEEALKLATDVAERVKSGEDIAALAEELSDDPSAKQNRGDLGYFERGRMVPAFEQAAFALQKAGDTAGPVKTPFGYHVIQLADRQAAEKRPFEDVSGALIDQLQSSLTKDVRSREIARVQNVEGVELNLPAIEALEAKHGMQGAQGQATPAPAN